MPKAASILSIDISAPDCNGRKERRKVVEMEGLWTEEESMD
jgi:hypothetical protein